MFFFVAVLKALASLIKLPNYVPKTTNAFNVFTDFWLKLLMVNLNVGKTSDSEIL